MLNGKVTDLYRGVGNRIAATTNGSQTNYLHYDALNSVVGITNEQVSNNKNIRYHDFGALDDNNTQRSDSTGGTATDPHGHYTYTGQEWDEHAEIYEFYSRAYDPVFGVWLRQDDYRGTPNDPQSLHRYNYVKQSPTNFWDEYRYYAGDPFADPKMEYYEKVVKKQICMDGGKTAEQCDQEYLMDNYIEYRMDPLADFKKEITSDEFAAASQELRENVDVIGEVANLCAAVLFEPYDWATTFYGWSKGDFSPWDLAGLLPLVPTKLDEGAGLASKLFKKYGDDAGDVAKGSIKISDTARKIADGHAFTKHIEEFKHLNITTKDDLAKHVQKIMDEKKNFKNLSNGRSAYWDDITGTILIIDPKNIDGGTTFIPDDGIDYFLRQK